MDFATFALRGNVFFALGVHFPPPSCRFAFYSVSDRIPSPGGIFSSARSIYRSFFSSFLLFFLETHLSIVFLSICVLVLVVERYEARQHRASFVPYHFNPRVVFLDISSQHHSIIYQAICTEARKHFRFHCRSVSPGYSPPLLFYDPLSINAPSS